MSTETNTNMQGLSLQESQNLASLDTSMKMVLAENIETAHLMVDDIDDVVSITAQMTINSL